MEPSPFFGAVIRTVALVVCSKTKMADGRFENRLLLLARTVHVWSVLRAGYTRDDDLFKTRVCKLS